MATGAQIIVGELERAGVEVCFGLPGVHNLALWEALRSSPIRLVGVRHEQAAAYAADGYARATGRLGVALTTTGPGAANTLGAVGEAWASRSPILVIATDIPSTLRRDGAYRGVLHETAGQAAMFAPVVKVVHLALRAEDVAGAAAGAAADAVRAPTRPVYLEIATDLLAAEVPAGGGEAAADEPAADEAAATGGEAAADEPAADEAAATGGEAAADEPAADEAAATGGEAAAGEPAADEAAATGGEAAAGEPAAGREPAAGAETAAALAAAAAALGAAERPLIWAGGGARDAGAAVARLAERIAAPVLTTYGAAGLLPPGHPCRVGLPPHVEPAGRLWDEADVVVAVGSDLDGVQTQNFAQPQPPALISIGLERPANYRVDVHVRGDASLAAELADRLPARGGLPDLAAARASACETLDATALRFLDAIRFAVPADANLVVDMCIPGYWLAGFHAAAAPRRLQVPLGWGTLGYAFPAALGAALATDAPTVSISGDGGFLFACGELATMAQEHIPLTAVIVDDGGYGMLRYDQAKAGEQSYGVDLHTPDFEAMAAAFGVRAETVDGLGDAFGEALARHVGEPGPSVLVARTPVPLVPPPNTSPNWYRKR